MLFSAGCKGAWRGLGARTFEGGFAGTPWLRGSDTTQRERSEKAFCAGLRGLHDGGAEGAVLVRGGCAFGWCEVGVRFWLWRFRWGWFGLACWMGRNEESLTGR